MYKIYFICDWDGLCYVGKTKISLSKRLTRHRSDRNRGKYCSSSKLDLYNCFIELIEECDKSQSKQREKYWINYIDCVNDVKLNYDHIQYQKQWRIKNKEKRKQIDKKYSDKNKYKINENKRERYYFKKYNNDIAEYINEINKY